MPIDLETIANSRFGVSLLSAIASRIPRHLGHRIADLIAQGLAQQHSSRLVRAIRANQWVVLGEDCSPNELDSAVFETLRNSACSVFDLYHYLHDPEAVRRMLVLDATTQQLIARAEFESRGLVVVGIHLSNFDLILRWFCTHGYAPMVLTLPDPRGGRRTEYEMRRRIGMNLVPTTVSGVRRALRHLQQGGVVLAGIDHPVPQPRLLPRFFGRPAALPMHHVFLAQRANVPLVLIAATLEPDGRYHVCTSEPFEFGGGEDRSQQHAERVLQTAEPLIRRAPHQWSVPRPVWPSALDLVPAWAVSRRRSKL